jgi:hypothetical protein
VAKEKTTTEPPTTHHQLPKEVLMKKQMLGVLAAMSLLFPAAAFAHHGWAGNDDKEFEITGTVSKTVSLAGPHATMQIKAADGKVWDLTLAPPPRTQAAGLKEDSIPMGATVTAHGHRNRDQGRLEVKTERVTFNGKTFNVYPDRN